MLVPDGGAMVGDVTIPVAEFRDFMAAALTQECELGVCRERHQGCALDLQACEQAEGSAQWWKRWAVPIWLGSLAVGLAGGVTMAALVR